MNPHSTEDRRLAQAKEEIAVFQTFLKAFPSFACEVEHFERPAGEFPDIVVRLTNHGEVDFELGEWLDGAQMQQAKRAEQLETKIREAIGEQQVNISNHIRFVMLTLREGAPRLDPRDRDALQAEIDRLIRTVEELWPSQRHWQSPQGYLCKDFGGYPTLAKYLMSAHFDPLRFGLEPGSGGRPTSPGSSLNHQGARIRERTLSVLS